MPNWCDTRIIFDSEDDRKKAEPFYKGLDAMGRVAEVTFNVLVPMPEHIFRGNLGQKEYELYGKDNWYDWSYEHWGVKWDAGDPWVDKNVVGFNSAWCPAEPWFEALSKALEGLGIHAHIDTWTEGCGSLEDACDGYEVGKGGYGKSTPSEAILDDYRDWYEDDEEDERA